MAENGKRVVKAALDRFEAAMAVFEDREAGTAIPVPRVELPSDARPGDWALVDVSGERPRVVEWLPDESDAKKRELQDFRELLRAKRETEDGP